MKRLLLGAVVSAQDTTEIANEYAKAHMGCARTMKSLDAKWEDEPHAYRVTPAYKSAMLTGCYNGNALIGEAPFLAAEREDCKQVINKLEEATENYVGYESLRLTRGVCKKVSRESEECSDLCRLKKFIFTKEPSSEEFCSSLSPEGLLNTCRARVARNYARKNKKETEILKYISKLRAS
jgi:hypothetical protein